MDDRQSRLALLARENNARRVIPSFLAGLSNAIGEPVEPVALLSLTETDALRQASTVNYLAVTSDPSLGYSRFFDRESAEEVFQTAHRLADHLQGEDGFLLMNLSEQCGAIRVPVTLVVKRAEAVIDFDGDTLLVLSLDHTQGLMIDYNPDDRDETYQIAAWGNSWPRLVHESIQP